MWSQFEQSRKNVEETELQAERERQMQATMPEEFRNKKRKQPSTEPVGKVAKSESDGSTLFAKYLSLHSCITCIPQLQFRYHFPPPPPPPPPIFPLVMNNTIMFVDNKRYWSAHTSKHTQATEFDGQLEGDQFQLYADLNNKSHN